MAPRCIFEFSAHPIKPQRVFPKDRRRIIVTEAFVFLRFFDLVQDVLVADFVGKVAGEEDVVVAGAFDLVVEAQFTVGNRI